MRALLPALVRDEASRALMLATLAHLPPPVTSAIVHVDGLPHDAPPPAAPGRAALPVRWLHRPRPAGKWSAIAGALAVTGPPCEPLLLIDADDPMTPAGLAAFCEPGLADGLDLVIGRRDRVALASTDRGGPDHARVVIELFVDVLVTQRLAARTGLALPWTDLQSGLYLLSPKACARIDFGRVGDYGGEVALFEQAVTQGLRWAERPVQARAQQGSSYSIEHVCRSLAALPLVREAGRDALAAAREALPQAYPDYLREVPATALGASLDRLMRAIAAAQ